MERNSQAIQSQLVLTWKNMLYQGQALPTFDEVQFREFSQNGEDGILLFVFAILGTTNKKVLEICAGDGQMCNSANLIINHGWQGFLLDGDERKVASGQSFYGSCPDTQMWPPAFHCHWITRDNVNDVVAEFNLRGSIDLLSIDIDGNDYWIFDALDIVEPRVVIAEYQQGWGPELAVTQVYDENFQFAEYRKENLGRSFCGASLPAMVKAAKRKGLRLVGCERKCFNAIFVREGLAEDVLPTISAEECFHHPMARYNVERLPALVDLKDPFWVEV